VAQSARVIDRRAVVPARPAERWRADEGPADELNCLRGILTAPILQAAEARARVVRTGADQVLIQWGVIEADAYLRHLADYLGVPVAQFADGDRCHCPLTRDQLPFAAASGVAPVQQGGALFWTVAPRCFAARELSRRAFTEPELIARMRLSAPRDFNQFLADRSGRPLAQVAAGRLHRRSPAFSAAPPTSGAKRRRIAGWLALAMALSALLWLTPVLMAHAGSSALSLWFIAFAGLRLAGGLLPSITAPSLSRMPDAELPVYTIIAALRDEASSVGPLLDAIDALDYPHEKLDVIVVLEPDDLQTRAAIARRGARPHQQVLVAPSIGPKTKPKALNFALHFARGYFIAVYDAEDAPDPGQLRAALDVFRTHGNEVACAQAKLCIDNLTHTWLSKMFAAEYAGQFEVLLPGLVALLMPLPLGGSSNHFRTSVLREVGGWDAYNVTEDADLGFRLARFGYRSVVIDSITSEEAPIRFGGWLRQRSRWMKGWMQTWCVHMRAPRRLWRETGWRGVLALNIVLGGNILTAFAYPVLALALLYCLATGTSDPLLGSSLAPLHLGAIASGLLSTVVLGLVGLKRQGRLRNAGILLLMPIYWGCLSIATWRALWQFWSSRHVWEKTEHGLVRRWSTTSHVRSAMRERRRAPHR
jgi:cellulose synthase/poly-beta-1,6-N-acetylglucosamine synthase-like glycosyltransferase